MWLKSSELTVAGHRAFQSYTQWLVIKHLHTVACNGAVQSCTAGHTCRMAVWMLYIWAALFTLIASPVAPQFQVQVQRWTAPAPSAQFRQTVTPCGVGVSVVHDSSLFSGLASSCSSLHLQESGIAHGLVHQQACAIVYLAKSISASLRLSKCEGPVCQ